jgi:hypothetical protein
MENEHEQIEGQQDGHQDGHNEDEIDGVKLENENLKRELQACNTQISGLQKTLAEAKQAIVETSVDLAQAVAAYKTVSLKANPGLVADMVKGNTIAEVDAAVKQAKELVDSVRQEVSAENLKVRVPAGAPPRTLSDFTALSAREKIKFAVENR